MDKLKGWIELVGKWAGRIAALAAAILAGMGTVAVRGCNGNPPTMNPPTNPSPPTEPKVQPPVPRPWDALAKIQFGNAGCTLTVIGPRRADGRWNGLTAAHCIDRIGQTGKAWLKDGRVVTAEVVNFDRRSDHAWCVLDLNDADVAFALLADVAPKAGDKVYHGGYGIHIPGNREDGVVVQPDNGAGQTQYRISVSSGDSGGGIAMTATGRILSPVCCTTNRGGVGDVWGATFAECLRTMPGTTLVFEEWTPIPVPLKMPE